MFQPFIYGRPVQGKDFIGREAELQMIFNRIRNSESSAIIGEPHIGKTSTLLQIASKDVQNHYLQAPGKTLRVALIDLHPIEVDYDGVSFWKEALEEIGEHPGSAAVVQRLRVAEENAYNRRSLEKLFTQLAAGGTMLVLLLDEFDRLIRHPNFQDSSFYTTLRSLANRSQGLAVVTTSRLDISTLNERGRGLLDTGSPFFNHFAEVNLRPFNAEAVERLLGAGGAQIGAAERAFIRRVAGPNPFLLQAAAAALLETTGSNRLENAGEEFFRRISFHFDDYWHYLDDRTRTTAVILCLMELYGQALGKEYAFGEIENADRFSADLKRLADLGLVEKVSAKPVFDAQHLLFWRGERWTVSSQAFIWWVRDVVIAETRKIPAYEEWLSKKQYQFLLTHEQWTLLTQGIRKVPNLAINMLIKALLHNLGIG